MLNLFFHDVLKCRARNLCEMMRPGYQAQGHDGAGCRCEFSLTPAPSAASDPVHWAVGIVTLLSIFFGFVTRSPG